MVCWVEPSAQNTIYISNNPSHKKASWAEFLSALACAEPPRSGAEPPRPDAEALGSVWPDHFVGDGGGIYTHPFAPNGHLLPHFHSDSNWSSLSLSQAWFSQLPCSNLCDSLRDLALESLRKLEKILLHSCALGEALAAWCVRYSWSLAPRWLAVAR